MRHLRFILAPGDFIAARLVGEHAESRVLLRTFVNLLVYALAVVSIAFAFNDTLGALFDRLLYGA